MNQQAIFESIIINSMKAIHKKNVEDKFYKKQNDYIDGENVKGTVEDLILLEREQMAIEHKEQRWLDRFSKIEIPEFISVKEYAEIAGLSIWKVYREIKKGNILADKIRNRWRIYTSIGKMEEVA